MSLVADYASRRKGQVALHLILSVGIVVFCSCAILVAIAFGLARWESNNVLVPCVLGVATLWFSDRRQFSRWLFIYSAAALVFTVVRKDLPAFARLSGMIPVIVGSVWLLKTAWRYCRALQCERRIARGTPYTLYL